MRYLHTMVRVSDLEKSLDFYCNKLGLKEVRRIDNEGGRFSLVFLCAPEDVERAAKDQAPLVELTWNWDEKDYQGGRNFGHLAYRVDDIYALCERLMKARRHHQPAAARRAHGVCPLARRDFDRAVAGRRRKTARRALGLDAQYGKLVGRAKPQISCRLAIMNGKIAVAIAIGLVGLILLAGLYTLWVGGDVSRTWSNRLMRLRVLAQFIAIIVIMAVLYFTSSH